MSTSTEHLVDSSKTVSGLRIPTRYRHDWALFADWCTATDQLALPASPEALALFLREHPAAPATQRRRVSAINTVHTHRGHPAPGRSETVRRRLDAARAARHDRLAPLLHQRAAQLPTTGWPSGLFGRRDALLLTLAATGMPFAQLARLRRGDIRLEAGTLVATTDGGERFCLAPESAAAECPAVAVYRRWAEIQAFLDAYPNTDLLAQHLTDPVEVEQVALTYRQARQPLLSPIDRWGHLPLMPQPMTAQSITSLVRDHLAGRAPARTPLPLRKQGDRDDPHVGGETGIDLDPHYYERGVAARRQARDRLDGLADVFDDIEARADALLQDLLNVLEEL
ncbi:hypothetical protein ACFYSW_28645 [Rhodococcus aetherivorans]|uniref:hypothetical protein n=1 Tax=Rhodococcus aetherivorans TaxID=191292 RepID=UPI0036CA527A